MTLYPIVDYPTPEDGGSFAVVPDLPGRTAHGQTAEEAVQEAQAAMERWLELAREDREILPEPSRYPAVAAAG